MKRIMILLLVSAMSLSLCACGRKNADRESELYQKYRDIIDDLEHGNYQSAIDSIENMSKQDVEDTTGSVESALTPEQIAWQTNVVGTWSPDKNASNDGHAGFSIMTDGTCTVDGTEYGWEIGNASENSAQIEVLDGQTKIYSLQFSVSADYGYKRASLYVYQDEHNAQGTTGSYYRNEDYTVVEITNDNWQDYFEIKEVISVEKNAFDEISQFYSYTYFLLKDTYGTVNPALSTGGVEYQYISTCQDITVDLTELAYVPVGKVHNTSDHNSTSEWHLSSDANNENYYGVSVGSFWGHDVNKNLTVTVWRPLNIEILRVQGTLYIVK